MLIAFENVRKARKNNARTKSSTKKTEYGMKRRGMKSGQNAFRGLAKNLSLL